MLTISSWKEQYDKQQMSPIFNRTSLQIKNQILNWFMRFFTWSARSATP